MTKALIGYFSLIATLAWGNTGGLAPQPSKVEITNENSGDPLNPGVGQVEQKQNAPGTKLVENVSKTINRSPAPSALDIRYHRDQVSGKYIIEEVNPTGPFKHLKDVKETKDEPKPHF